MCPCKYFYRPHPKDDGRLYFHFVCQFTPGGAPRQGGPHLGYPPIQVPGLSGGPTWGTPPSRSRWGSTWDTHPPSRSRWGDRPGYPPPSRSRWAAHPGYPPLDQYSMYLLHGGRYASCVHAVGLSC